MAAVICYHYGGAGQASNISNVGIINAASGYPLTGGRFEKLQPGIAGKLLHAKNRNNFLKDAGRILWRKPITGG
jgi:hypothetical protein